MHVAWRLHSLVCHFFGLVWFAGDSCRGTCTGVVYANAKTLSIQLFRDILSVFALLLSTRTQFRFPCSRSMSFYFESVCLPSLVYMCGRTSGEASNGAWYCGVYDFAFRDLEIRIGPLRKEVCVHGAKHASAWSCRRCCSYLRFPACGRSPNPISRSDHKLALSQTETLMQQKMFERNQMGMPGLLNSFRCVD